MESVSMGTKGVPAGARSDQISGFWNTTLTLPTPAQHHDPQPNFLLHHYFTVKKERNNNHWNTFSFSATWTNCDSDCHISGNKWHGSFTRASECEYRNLCKRYFPKSKITTSNLFPPFSLYIYIYIFYSILWYLFPPLIIGMAYSNGQIYLFSIVIFFPFLKK